MVLLAGKTKASVKSSETPRKRNTPTKISYSIDQKGTIESGHRMTISVKPENGTRRVEAAYITPSGRTGLQRASKLDGSGYEAIIKSDEAGEFFVSITAYGKRKVLSLLSTKYTIMEENNGDSKPHLTRIVDIPPPPDDLKNGAIKSWPVSGAYTKSLQNLNFSVADKYTNLRSGTLISNPNVKFKSYIFGSGNFGVVFKLQLESEFRALKCFTRASPDIAERYYFLSSYLSKIDLPFLVNFNYLTSAVRVIAKPKDFYPALMMDWVEGQNVNQFIEKHISKPDLIQKFAKNFVNSVTKMQMSGVAHGDLSGDNILVTDSGEPTFIDYDGMFIPSLAGKRAPEKGHENFQHPARNLEYSERLDNFSCLVIYLTALAVSEDREIWKYNNSDLDRLIFTSSDFSNPDTSGVFQHLRGMSRRIKKLTSLLEEFLRKDPLWDGASPRRIKNL